MADMVGSAVVQEIVSRAITFALGNREDQASQGHRHSAERLEMAVSELEFALERTAKLPITDVSMLHRRKMFKRAYVEGTDLLTRHRQHAQRGHGEVVQVEKRSKLWITRAMASSASSSSSGLSTDDARRFEWFAELAGRFLRDVESGCTLRHYTFCKPLIRHLLEGKTLRYEMELESQLRRFYMWPVCLEGRGVETMVEYWYEDYKMPEKYFHLALMLRVSESTDIVGTAIKCLQSMASQFKLATETATGELTGMVDLQYISNSHAPLWAEADEESHTVDSERLRPDPVCCKGCAKNFSSEMPHTIPEQVILFSFGCYIISAQEYNLPSSSDEVGRSVMRDQRSPLELIAVFAPHFVYKEDQPQEGYALEKFGDNVERRYVSLNEVAETIRSKAINCFLHQPELTGYAISWIAKHGFAAFDVQKPTKEINSTTGGRPKNQRNSKRRR